MFTRRQFLHRSTGVGVTCLSLQGAMPGLFARAAVAAKEADANDHVLVVVELAGGNDGLNTVIPFENDLYYKNRPTLGVPKDQVLRINDQFGFHPSFGAAADLFKDGKLAVVQGVGYPEPNRSHFRSMEIWHTASTAATPPTTGWLGRLLDAHDDPAKRELPRGLVCTGTLPQAFGSEKWSVPVIPQLEGASTAESPQDKLLKMLSRSADGKMNKASGALNFVRHQAEVSFRTLATLKDAATQYKSDVQYPPGLGEQLRRAAQVITADLGLRVIFVSQGGYDTHVKQNESHPGLLQQLGDSLKAFQADLKGQGWDKKVTTLIFSEFGRRVDENAGAGTDHGAGNCLFLMGSQIKPGLHGEHPSLEKLGDGDLIHATDFRSVYATLLENWLGDKSEKILGQAFPKLKLYP